MTDTNSNPEVKETPSVEVLQQQIENLNKGIAKYRDEAQAAIAKVNETESKFNSLKSEIESKKSINEEEEFDNLSKEDQKRLEVWAKKQGFVTKEEVEVERQRLQIESIQNIESQAIDEFLKQHPEYEKEEEWTKLKSLFGEYKQPTSLAKYRQILSTIHSQLNPDESRGAAKARAEIETKRRLGLGGGSQRTNDGSEETIDSLMEKYPRLSRDQIESRLAEIKSLYPSKDK